jgi:mycothiol synthase
MEVALDAAQNAGRTRLFASAREGSAGCRFLESLGMALGQVNHRNRLLLSELDRTLIEGWVDRAAERAAGYSLVPWDNVTPPEHIAAFCRVNDVMNTAPRDDLELEDEMMTPEILADHERVQLAMGTEWWTLCARHDATGEFVGFTEIFFSPWYPDRSWQGNTGVNPAHRNVGLGRWLKAVNLVRLLDERPEVAKVDTQNAGSNDAMLSINHALGFRPAAITNRYQGSIELIAKALA